MIFNGSDMVYKIELNNLLYNIYECINILRLNVDFTDIKTTLKTFSAEEIQEINERVLNCLKNKDDNQFFRKSFDSVLKDILIS